MSIEVLQNPLTAARDEYDRSRVIALFPSLESCRTAPFLALRPYLQKCPERFFDRSVFQLVLEWLRSCDVRDRDRLRQYFIDAGAELSMAMLFLRQINSEDWHDRPLLKGDDFEAVGFIDKNLHPTYLRLVEGIFAPLIRPMAHFSRLDRKKPTEGLDVFNLVEELVRSPMGPCVAPYRHAVRNGIGHGGITFRQSDIRYRDKKGNTETLDMWSIVRLCDDMLDTCNAIAAALKVFLISSGPAGYAAPHELLVEELMEETRSPWWSVTGCMQSEYSDMPQLLVYARPNTRDVLKVQWAATQTAAMAAHLSPGFDRYFLSLRTEKAWPGWAAFDGRRLAQVAQAGASGAHDFAVAIESEGGFMYVPTPRLPRILGRLDTFAQSWRLHWPLAVHQIRDNLGRLPVIARDAKMHRNSWGYVLNGAVVLPGVDFSNAASTVRSNRRRIIRAAARLARAEQSWFSVARYLPLGYARIAVVTMDFRRRRIAGFGLGPELICTLQRQRIRRIKSPDIMGSTIENSGSWRIAWNRSWIEAGGAIQPPPD